MAAKLTATFLLFVVLSQGFALPTSDVTHKDGGVVQHLVEVVPNGFKQCARSVTQILGSSWRLVGLSYELWTEYSKVSPAFDICAKEELKNPAQKPEANQAKEACQERAIFKFWQNSTKIITPGNKATERSLFGCAPNLMLVYDAVSGMFHLYGNYREIRKGFDEKREKCLKNSDSSKREKCLKGVEEEEKPAYQNVTDKFRILVSDLVTEGKGLLKCLTGWE